MALLADGFPLSGKLAHCSKNFLESTGGKGLIPLSTVGAIILGQGCRCRGEAGPVGLGKGYLITDRPGMLS